ncbi:Mu-like prophage major head subunit gpT family protein [Psychrobacter sp. FDAARGOS_221]|uniref:Mu-like prophage major head subunit gpT family protein n=1 Tax=Psychrobacter sp. FDAARGOS_221 TaxID=1975705 RepID=UPI000BB5542A|nr:Mu-like prophage major head subunit gpT family protein [Psychrobacter sp. FDAARGOS_221]PNK59459.1 head protein [Psychrobacter sp. FDAARGOS_221]PNK61472.1 head protein [Psychrobacter sp. FDAARGOS_221]
MALVNAATLSALNTAIKQTFQKGLDSVEPEYTQIATVVPSSTASNTYGWLGEMPDMREWIGERVLNDIKTHGYTIVNKLYESTIAVKRTDIEDDNLGTLTPLAEAHGRRAMQHPDKLVFGALKDGRNQLCYDGQNFFDTDHPVYEKHDGTGSATTVSNLDYDADSGEPAWYLLDTSNIIKPIIFQKRKDVELTSMTKLDDESVFMQDIFRWGARARHNVGYGFWQMAYMSNKPLTSDNLNAAIAHMQSQKADGGRELDIKPTLLVVPPSLRAKALELVKAERLANGQTNINKDVVDVLVTQRV